MSEPAATTRDVLSFGPFSLDAGRRLLLKDGALVELGARTLDTLIALLSRPNEAISKRDLMATVWPDVIVEEGNLRFHIATLRKVLGDGKDGARYISTLVGRGYSFVAPISRVSDLAGAHSEAALSFSHANLPGRLARMVGRDDDTTRLSAQLTTARFVSIVGAGGVGKTTVAIAVGHHLMKAFAGAVLFVDLGMLSDPGLVPMATASMLGLSVRSDDATPNLIAYLRDKRILLILDTCEHLIGAVAELAAQIFAAAPKVHILSTSREALQLDAEHVYRLDPLGCPPDDGGLTAASVQNFPAAQLFIERAMASGARLQLSDADAALVGDICRKLDGVALAIELTARRVESYGLQRTAALLDQRLTLLWAGPRKAVPRQKTLQATLDWSFALLSDLERLVICRLAVFVGHFTLDAALAVVSSATLDQSVVLSAMEGLVAKSMVVTQPIGASVRYRLLDTTRAYALEIDINSAEIADLAARHAAYYRLWLEQYGTEWSNLSTGMERSAHFAALNNVRAALEWCFGANGNAGMGVRLAAAATPVFLEMSLFPECHRWSERAILALDESTRGGPEDMHLQTCLGISSMYMHGQSDAARIALGRGLTIAEARGDVVNQVAVLGILSIFHSRSGDYKTALHHARLSRAAVGSEASTAAALAHSILGRSLLYVSDLSGALAELEAALQQWRSQQRTSYLGLDWKNWTCTCIAWPLWHRGYPEQAADRIREAVSDAKRRNNPTSLAVALSRAPLIFLWNGDLHNAEAHADWLISHAESHSLGPFIAVGCSYKGALAIRRGEASGGVKILEDGLARLQAARFEALNREFKLSLVQGLAAIGRFEEALTLIDETMRLGEANGNVFYMPETLRVKGNVLLQMPQPRVNDAETCFAQSLELSRRRSARSWELRTAVDLAGLSMARGRPEDARALLQPVLDQFTEGRETADLKAAERLLATLR